MITITLQVNADSFGYTLSQKQINTYEEALRVHLISKSRAYCPGTTVRVRVTAGDVWSSVDIDYDGDDAPEGYWGLRHALPSLIEQGTAIWTAVQDDAPQHQCLYCQAMLDGDEADLGPVPALDDDAAWVRIASEHAEWCEWVSTRAHRLAQPIC